MIVIYIIDFTALHVYVSNLHQVCWWERPTIPAASLMCNSFERAVHRYVMHRRGLLEHLSNGYDARFVKSDLRRTLTTPHPRGAVPAPAE